MNKPTAELTDAADVGLQLGQTADQPRVVLRSAAHRRRPLVAALEERGQDQGEADGPEGEQRPPEPRSPHGEDGPPEKSPDDPHDTRTLRSQLADNSGDVFTWRQ